MTASKGRTTRNFRRLSANLRGQRRPCCLCGQAIDYTVRWPHPDSFTVQHILPWSTHPHLREDPANLDAAHSRCNSSEQGRGVPPPLGSTSRRW